jgi:hypothetical protein
VREDEGIMDEEQANHTRGPKRKRVKLVEHLPDGMRE